MFSFNGLCWNSTTIFKRIIAVLNHLSKHCEPRLRIAQQRRSLLVEDYVFDIARRLGHNYFESEAVNETWYDNLVLSINMWNTKLISMILLVSSLIWSLWWRHNIHMTSYPLSFLFATYPCGLLLTISEKHRGPSLQFTFHQELYQQQKL